MHHEKQTSSKLLEALETEKRKRTEQAAREFGGLVPSEETQQPGPTGEFPEGKLTENDEGEIKMQISAYKGKVIVNFGVPVASIGMSAKQARSLATALWNQANRLRIEENAFRDQERKEKAAARRRH